MTTVMNARRNNRWVWWVGAAVGIVFFLDWVTPLGVVVWMLYLVAVLLAASTGQGRFTVLAAGVCTGLIWLGLVVSPPGIPAPVAVLNRSIGSVVLWLVAVLARQRARLAATVAQTSEELRASQERVRLAGAEAALQEAKRAAEHQAAEMTALMEAVPAVVFVAEDTGCRSMRGNRSCVELLGVPAASNVSMSAPPAERMVHFRAVKEGRDVPADQLPMQQAARGQPVQDYEMDLVFEDGSRRTILGNAVPLRDAGGQPRGAVGAFVDITARKQAEAELRQYQAHLEELVAERTEALRASEERLRLGLDAARMGTFDWDIVTGQVRWTPETERLWGLPVGGYNGTYDHWRRLVHPADLPQAEARAQKALADPAVPYEFEHRIIWPDGTVRWIFAKATTIRDAAGKPVRMVGLNMDITERKQAEQQLQEHAAELGTAYRRAELLATNAVRLLQARQPRQLVRELCLPVMRELDCQVFLNFLAEPAAHRLRLNAYAGISAETAATIEWLDFGEAVSGAVAQTGQHIVAEQISRAPDPRLALSQELGLQAYCCQPLTGPGQQLLGTLSFGARNRDSFAEADLAYMKAVADQVALALAREREEQALAEANRQLAAANRELEAFSYTVSHDLRAPLRHVQGFTHLLAHKHRAELSSEAQAFIDMIGDGAALMGQLVDDLLAFARLGRQALQRQTIAPGALVREAWAQLAPDREGRPVEFTLHDLPPCQADPVLLKCVWLNLLQNALKFSRGRAPARIEVGGQQQQPGESVYYVRDNGVGFDMRYAGKLFGVFQRLHRAEEYEGTGVGLATVQRIIQRHGGRVWAEAEPDRGATFHFSLPTGAPP